MKHPIILDACNLINMLRIEDEGEYLSKALRELDIHLSQVVYQEVQQRILKNPLDKEQRKHISALLPFFEDYIVWDFENLIADSLYYEELHQFSSHIKKDNGELHSSLLALYLSRSKKSRLYFYTDDFPAKLQFAPYFAFQQIGTIGDSVDLLLFLYWVRDDFKLGQLKKYLYDLYTEYVRALKDFSEQMEKKGEEWMIKYRRDKSFQENFRLLRNGYLNFNFENLDKAIAYFKANKRKYNEIVELLDQFPAIDNETQLTLKIKETMDHLSNYKIYKS